MSEKLNIHPAARDELHDIIRHYAAIDDLENDEGEPLALAFHDTFYRYAGEISSAPTRFSRRQSPTRRVNLTPRFGAYYIAYMIWREQPVILAVAHGKRRPGYWRRRIREARQMF